MLSKELKVKEVRKYVNEVLVEFCRPDGTVYSVDKIPLFLVITADNRGTYAGEIKGRWYEAFGTYSRYKKIRVV